MADIFDYLEWRGDIDVSQIPLGEVDYLIIGCFSYFPFDSIVPEKIDASPISLEYAIDKVIDLCGENGDGRGYHLSEDGPLALRLTDCPRFIKLDITGFVNVIDYDKEEQFAAFTLVLPDKSPLVVFRGTDRNIVGWKEDFNMAFNETVPSQVDAVKYLNEVAEKFEGPIRVCGHSKGGNLAIYASAYCRKEAQDRILEIWNLDGPGFLQNQSKRQEFKNIEGRLHSYVPQLSVVGMMFEHAENYQVVQSDGKLFWQHSLYTWKLRRGKLLIEPELENLSRNFNKVVKQWLTGIDYETRQKLVEGMYEVVNMAGANRVEDFLQMKTKYNLVKSFAKLESDKRKLLLDAVWVFAEAIKVVFKNERAQKKLEKLAKLENMPLNDDNDQALLRALEEIDEDDEADDVVYHEGFVYRSEASIQVEEKNAERNKSRKDKNDECGKDDNQLYKYVRPAILFEDEILHGRRRV